MITQTPSLRHTWLSSYSEFNSTTYLPEHVHDADGGASLAAEHVRDDAVDASLCDVTPRQQTVTRQDRAKTDEESEDYYETGEEETRVTLEKRD